MVETGPIADIMATLLEPIRFMPFEIRKLGKTVATIANSNPYPQCIPENPAAGISHAKAKCIKIPVVAVSIA